MWHGNSGRCGGWNQPLQINMDGKSISELRRLNSHLVGKATALKWSYTELRRENAQLQKQCANLRGVVASQRHEMGFIRADLEDVRTERNTLLAAGRASDMIMERGKPFAVRSASSVDFVHELPVSESKFGPVISVASEFIATPNDLSWDGFYKPGPECDSASRNPCAHLNATEKEELRRKLLTQRGPNITTGNSYKGTLSLAASATSSTSSPALSGGKDMSAVKSSEELSLDTSASTKFHASPQEAITENSTEGESKTPRSPSTGTKWQEVSFREDSSNLAHSDGESDTDCLEEGARTETDNPGTKWQGVSFRGDSSNLSHSDSESDTDCLEEGARTETDNPEPTQHHQKPDTGDGLCPTEDSETEDDCADEYGTEDQPLASLPDRPNTQNHDAESVRSGNFKQHHRPTLNLVSTSPVLEAATSASGVDSTKLEASALGADFIKVEASCSKETIIEESAPDEKCDIAPEGLIIPDSRSETNRGEGTCASHNRSERCDRRSVSATGSTSFEPSKNALCGAASARRICQSSDGAGGEYQLAYTASSARACPRRDNHRHFFHSTKDEIETGDMADDRSRAHTSSRQEKSDEEAALDSKIKMEDPPHINPERYTHVTYCCWCDNQRLQTQAVALCESCPRTMCLRCAHRGSLTIPSESSLKDIVLPSSFCRCCRWDSQFPTPRRDIQPETHLLKQLSNHDLALQFREPVDIEANPNYLSAITHSKMMDLATMAQKMKKCHYRTTRGQRLFQRDLQQIWINCWKYAEYDPKSCAPVPGIVACSLILVKMVNKFCELYMRIPTLMFDDKCWLAVNERVKHGRFSQMVQSQAKQESRKVTHLRRSVKGNAAENNTQALEEECQWEDHADKTWIRPSNLNSALGKKRKYCNDMPGMEGSEKLCQLAEIGDKLAQLRRP